MLFSFAANIDPAYTMDYFRKALFLKPAYALNPALHWGNYTELHSNRINEGYQVIRVGSASGILVGGHMPSFSRGGLLSLPFLIY
jgi:hypothetical protein